MLGIVISIFGAIIALLVVIAVLLLNGKGAFLIAGYNTMSREEKATYDEKALCRFVGVLLLVISASMLTYPIGLYLQLNWLTYCGTALVLLLCIGGGIYANTSSRFRSTAISERTDNTESCNTGSSASTVAVIAVVAISLIITIAVGFMLSSGAKETVVNVSSDGIEIKAMYGVSVDFSAIAGISLIEQSMSDIGTGERYNGYGGVGQTLKGHFRSDMLGDILLFVQAETAPTILIERDGEEDIYISLKSGNATVDLYNAIMAAYIAAEGA